LASIRGFQEIHESDMLVVPDPTTPYHHEVATGGQREIDKRFAPLARMAANVMIYKYVMTNVARQRGMTTTFMPKPLFGDNGSGMHVHQSGRYCTETVTLIRVKRCGGTLVGC
jgi:glutamine synthetase